MGYAAMTARVMAFNAYLAMAQQKQMMVSDEQTKLATQHSGLQRNLSAMQTSNSSELSQKYAELSSADSTQRDSILKEIEEKRADFNRATDEMNNEIYDISNRENIMEREVKRMDAIVTVLQKQLEAVQQAQSWGINNATPKYGGIQ